MKEIFERYISVQEAATFLSVKTSTIYVWKLKGIIPYYKIGGKKLAFKLSELQKFAESGNGKSIQAQG
jgi:excisionase family DNA binding protein